MIITRKLYLIILMALMSLTGYAQETGDVVYVYQTNGDVLSFFREEIVEMSYSYEDTLGVTHDEIASQLITLEDSVYMIPLDRIDSISFVTPPTVLQAGVTDLTASLSQYAVDSKELTLYLSGSTPESLLPAVGTRVVLAERSFAGDVASVTQEDGFFVVTVTPVDLEEIFETYYAVSVIDVEEDGTATTRPKDGRRAKDFEKTIKLPAVGFELNQEMINFFLPGDDEIPAEVKFSAKVQPTITVKASTIVNNGKHVKVSLVGDFNYTKQFTFKGKVDKSIDLVKPKDVLDIPLGQTFLFLYNRWGFQLKPAAELSVDMKWQQLYRATFDWSYNSKAKKQEWPKATFQRVSEDFTPEGSIKGSILIGPYTDIGIKFVTTELAKAALHIEAGLELAGNYVLVNKDIKDASNSTKFYEFLKAQKVELNFVVNSSIDLSFLKTEQSIDLPWNINKNLATLSLVPTFSDVTFDRDGNNGAASAKISGICIIPAKTGFIVSDKDENKLDTWTTEKPYWAGGSQMSHTFNGLDEEREYVLNPKVVLLGYDIKANPAAEMTVDVFPVRITDFKQTDARYSKKQGFEYEGRYYYYKFNVITTVELNPETQKVKDWGYIYHDFYGVDKKISCANLGSNPYPDVRYAYYYNERSRTVKLSPYIQYEGETDIKIGNKKEYLVEYVYSGLSSCPDEHHPHAIDLGLPSGTLWACCNVGADEPEEFGTYYQSGNPGNGNPAFKADDDTFEFSGTMFDPATVEWGVEWATPNSGQMEELVEYSTHEDKYEMLVMDGSHFIFPSQPGGTGYLKVYGPNGNYILMPAAGIMNVDGSYKNKYQPAYQYTEGALSGTWKYNGGYWTDYNDGEYAEFLRFSESYFTDRSLEKNQENEVSFDVVVSKDLMQAMPIRPVINKNSSQGD